MTASTDWIRDGKTHDSGSIISGLNSLECNSDDFGQALIQHARDQQRVDQVLIGSSQPFRKARPLHFDNTHLLPSPVNESPSSDASDSGVHENTHTDASEPAFNIPRDWGRKGRTRTNWLRRGLVQDSTNSERYLADETSPSAFDPIGDRVHVERGRNLGHPSSLARDTFPTYRQRLSPSPGHGDGEPGTRDREALWDEEEDLTRGSLLQGTPLVRATPVSRRHDLDPVQGHKRDRELLSRITDSDISGGRGHRLDLRVSQKSDPILARTLRHAPEDKKWGGARALGTNKENVPRATSDSLTDGMLHRDRQPDESAALRRDATHIMKRLAMATSKSPTAVPNRTAQESKPHSDEARAIRQTSAQAPEVVPKTDMTPYNPPRHLSAKTPRVMGAWIDTPLSQPHGLASSQSKTRLPPQEAQPSSRVVPQPASALQNLLHPLIPSSEPLSAGDETLASLAAILDPTLAADLSATLNLDEIRSELDVLRKLRRPLSKAQEERRDELLAIQGMSERLQAARRGVQEVGRGLRDVEKRVGELNGGLYDSSGPVGHGRCESCAKGIWRGAWDETRGLVISSRGSRSEPVHGPHRTRKLTWLGAIVIAVATWWVAERSLCALYCHPATASSMSSYGVDPDAPTYPFVLPTLIFRPVRWIWSPLSSFIFWLLGSIWTGVVSYGSIPFEPEVSLDDAASALSSSRMYAAHASTAVRPWTRHRPTVTVEHDLAASQRRQNTGAIHETRVGIGRDEADHDTMDADAEVEGDGESRSTRRSGLRRLWSWRAGTAEAVEIEATPVYRRESRHERGSAFPMEQRVDEGEMIGWEKGDSAHVESDPRNIMESVGNLWETG